MLPSQTGRPSSSRSHMYRRKRSRRIPMVLFFVLVIGGGIVVFKWFSASGDPSPAQASGEAMPQAGVVSSGSPKDLKTQPGKPPGGPTSSLASSVSTEQRTNSALNSPLRVDAKPIEKVSMGSAAPANLPQIMPDRPTAEPKPAVEKPMTLATAPVTADRTPSSPTAPAIQSGGPAAQRIKTGLDLLAQNKPVEARALLSAALFSSDISPADADRIRLELTKVNQRLVFSPEIVPGDPFVSSYVIESGDALVRLPRKLGLFIDWRFLQRINNISSPERIQVGQRIKTVKGPFNAVINKSEFRMDLYMGSGENRVYVKSIMVGLGEHGATPEGAFTVKPNSKLIDPAWTNPRTGEHFASKDPNNPLGKYWIGLIGISDNIRELETYGIHGTIDPDSIGQQRSMGCVRLLADDIALVFELLVENASRVEIRGEDYP